MASRNVSRRVWMAVTSSIGHPLCGAIGAARQRLATCRMRGVAEANGIDGNVVLTIPCHRDLRLFTREALLPQPGKERHSIQAARIRKYGGTSSCQEALQDGEKRTKIPGFINHIGRQNIGIALSECRASPVHQAKAHLPAG